jgi:flagellar hook-length control protein FliK
MTVSAVSLATSPSPSDAAAPKAARAAGFGSLLASAGRPAQQSDTAPTDDADTKANARTDEQDDDRDDDKRDSAKPAEEDPAALLAMVGAAAMIPSAATAPAAAKAKPAADTGANAVANLLSASTTSPAATQAPSTSPADATAQSAQETAAAAQAAMPAAQSAATPAPAKSARATQKTTVGTVTTSTNAMLAGRAVKAAPAAHAHGDASDDTSADDGDSQTAQSFDPSIVPTAAPGVTPASVPVTTPGDGQTLDATGADRQLDLAKGDAWLDGLARDIARTADSGGTLRFQLSPQRLGNLDVQVTRGDDGTAVKMTTASPDAQSILADASPRLVEQARAHGVHISDATIDLGSTGTATGGGDRHRDSMGGGSQDGAGSQQRNAANSAGTGDNGGQARSSARNERDLYHGASREDAIAGAPTGGARHDLDAGYA